MPSQSHFSHHFSQLNPDTDLVLTPNERLSRFVEEDYNHYQMTQGVSAFPSLTCHSYRGWLEAQWQRVARQRALLTAQQEVVLWETIISVHPDTPPLLNLNATAQAARDAWALCHEWQLDLHTLDDSLLLQSHHLFALWWVQFEQQLIKRDSITRAELPKLITLALQEGQCPVPQQVFLYGFDEHTPALTQLLTVFALRGCEVQELPLSVPAQTQVRHEFSDPQEELEKAAWWCFDMLKRNPEANIAIVVPDLTARRGRVVRTFNRVFEPQTISPEQPQHAPGFNISAGEPLLRVPLVQAALAVLQLNLRTQDIDALGALLRSPFVGAQAELNARALLDGVLRRQGELQMSRQLLISCAAELVDAHDEPVCPDFYQRLTQFDKLAKSCASKKTALNEWFKVFTEQLYCLGWPGERTLDTLEYQQLQAWRDALEEWCALDVVTGDVVTGDVVTGDVVTGDVAQADALSLLRKCLQQHSFQAQTKRSPLQVLGVLEAAGLPFDYLWVLGLDDETWPPVAAPNPLLPLTIQVANHTPQSSAERETLYAQRLTARWLHSARHVVFSHAQSKDDKQLLPSPLTQQIPVCEVQVPLEASMEVQQMASGVLETVVDNAGGAVLDATKIRGGSAILRDMAACPFQAFARHRLHASEIEDIGVGLNAAERGNLVHHTMEIVWRKLRDAEHLQVQSDAELRALIASAIEQALQHVRHKNFVGYRFVALETQRLQELILQWLRIEKQRAPFTVVFNESRRQLSLAGLTLRVRYDRVDRLQDGSLFVIDYKTGACNLKAWEGERPEQPQVPLYAIANKQEVVGAAFAQINSSEVVLKGLSEHTDIAPGLKDPQEQVRLELPETWAAILQHWQTTLERLAEEFLAGNAAVDPKVPGSTCRYCELRGFCRVRESLAVASEVCE